MSSQTESGSTAAPEWSGSKAELLRVVADEDAREIFYSARNPKTVPELIEECGIPKTTAYRKIEQLVECGLLEAAESSELRGNEAVEYRRGIDEVRIRLRDSLSIEGLVFKE